MATPAPRATSTQVKTTRSDHGRREPLRPVGRRHLTIADVCDELAVARSTFYDWRAKGTAPRCIKLPNGELRVRRTDLDAWIESRTESAA
ncbi:Prophage CP4-57 regulatory [Candidatus Protofrankia datiscae]|uniref:Prophage CP4-57 regulatory n=1 Tax=Candidatus Protofrankia datiscae TaxID=2716812 RepID=F8B492_9ACTN|nr:MULTISPECIES: helix-turn-helix domain-containing protein [Protofrankia]AEH11009.1 Prophage CP4-57 regulatory [Candidatus Protofrankia datiscae]